MKKLSVLVGAIALSASTFAVAQVSGFGAPVGAVGPQGFAYQVQSTVQSVMQNAYDDQYVTLTGSITNYLGHDRYIFTDKTGSIEVELDDDRNWSYIQKDQPIMIYAEVDRDFATVTLDVKDARPL